MGDTISWHAATGGSSSLRVVSMWCQTISRMEVNMKDTRKCSLHLYHSLFVLRQQHFVAKVLCELEEWVSLLWVADSAWCTGGSLMIKYDFLQTLDSGTLTGNLHYCRFVSLSFSPLLDLVLVYLLWPLSLEPSCHSFPVVYSL